MANPTPIGKNAILHIVKSEHDDSTDVTVKKAGIYVWNSSTSEWERVEGIATEATLAKLVSTYHQIINTNDLVKTINYTNSAKSDIASIVQSSASMGATATETFDDTGATTLVITRGVA